MKCSDSIMNSKMLCLYRGCSKPPLHYGMVLFLKYGYSLESQGFRSSGDILMRANCIVGFNQENNGYVIFKLKVPSHQIRLALKWYGWTGSHGYKNRRW
jgi:hypothetical protein